MRLAGVIPGQVVNIYRPGMGRREAVPGQNYFETSCPKYLSEIAW